MKNITGNGLKVENMIFVYKQIKNKNFIGDGQYACTLGYFEACVQNFTPMYEDLAQLNTTKFDAIKHEIPYKTIFGKIKYRKETYQELLLRYAEEFFVKNNINFSLKADK